MRVGTKHRIWRTTSARSSMKSCKRSRASTPYRSVFIWRLMKSDAERRKWTYLSYYQFMVPHKFCSDIVKSSLKSPNYGDRKRVRKKLWNLNFYGLRNGKKVHEWCWQTVNSFKVNTGEDRTLKCIFYLKKSFKTKFRITKANGVKLSRWFVDGQINCECFPFLARNSNATSF